MSESKAVFLSYASDDAAPAQRIAEALRQAGVTVWFDKEELRGGDAWDASIRRQIRECALFVPIISSNTEAREEGYFRREWNLAADRTLDMGQNRAFIVPVAVDQINEKEANVPDKFRSVQWMRLPEGHATPAFVAHVRRLLGIGAQGQHSPTRARSGARTPMEAARRRSVVLYAGLGLVFFAIAGGGWYFLPKIRPALTAVATNPEKSVAVLPFVNMSADKDQDYFSDGLTEELINHLAHAPGLKVISRTSSFQFKGKNEDIRTIAAKLGVANLLEGSVRKNGTELRITAQLVQASDGAHLWSQTYDRNLKDVFKVQDNIASTVAQALKVVLRTDGAAIEPTSKEAYSLILQGRFLRRKHNKRDNDTAIELLKRATQIEPNYALAWAELGGTYRMRANMSVSHAEMERNVRNARAALQRALSLDPKLATAHYTLAGILITYDLDFAAAAAEDSQIRDLRNDETPDLVSLAQADFSVMFGRMTEAISVFRQLLDRDPLSIRVLSSLSSALYLAGNYEESLAVSQRMSQLAPEAFDNFTFDALDLLFLKQYKRALEVNSKQSSEDNRLFGAALVEWAMGQKGDSDRDLRALISKYANDDPYEIGCVYAFRGDTDQALEWLQRAYKLHDGNITSIKTDPLLRSVRPDPRFQALLAQLGLAGERSGTAF
jgi:TolB-like protein